MMKYAVITGSTKGIGKAIAEKLINEGFFVIVNYAHDDESRRKFENEHELERNKFEVIKTELSSWENAQYFISVILSITNHIECLVLCAGATDRSPFAEVTRENWEYVINTNISAPFFIIQGLQKHITPELGRIILIGSVCGIYPHAGSLAYGVTKAASHQMAKDLVKVFAQDHITVNAIAPGFIDTPRQKMKAPDHRKRIEEKTALKRFGRTEEIASLCWEIVNNQFINGSVLSIDGGYSYK